MFQAKSFLGGCGRLAPIARCAASDPLAMVFNSKCILKKYESFDFMSVYFHCREHLKAETLSPDTVTTCPPPRTQSAQRDG